MNKLITALTLTLGIAIAGHASAGPYWQGHRGDRHSFVETARVVKVKSIYETVRIEVPEKRCWHERAHHFGHNDRSYTAPLAGAIIGGVAGNQFGEGSGKTALTVAGTLLGASIANDLDNDMRHTEYPPHRRRHCETIQRHEDRKELVGYHVNYRYRGRIFGTRTSHDPGDTIRVRITLRPVD